MDMKIPENDLKDINRIFGNIESWKLENQTISNYFKPLQTNSNNIKLLQTISNNFKTNYVTFLKVYYFCTLLKLGFQND